MFLKWKFRTWFAGCIVVGVVALFGFVVWRAAAIQAQLPSFTALPVIVAPSGPARVPPDAPGGLQVPHQDKTVFDLFEGGKKVRRPEKLLSRADTPLEVSMETEATEISEVTMATDVVKRTELKTGMVVAARPKPRDDMPLTEITERNIVVPIHVEGEEDWERVASSSTSSLDFRYGVQLASFRSLDAAEAAWEKIFIRVPYLLADLSPTIVKVDLAGAGGVFFRLHAGALPNLEAAAALCRSLTAEALDCLIVRP